MPRALALLALVAVGLLLPRSALALDVVISHPVDNATVSGMLTIEVVASNGPGPYFFTILVDGASTAISGRIDGAIGTYTWNTTLGDNGPHILTVTGSDATGATAAATRLLFVNNPNVERLRLVSARDHIEGAMPGPQAVYADRDRIYLATVDSSGLQGRLYVLARDRTTDFPVLETIDFPHPLRAVRGDDVYLYVAVWDSVVVYRKTRPLTLVTTLVPPAPNGGGPSSLAVIQDRIYVGMKQTHLTADERHVYLAALGPGDIGVEILRDTWAAGRTFGSVFEADTVAVFDRVTGARTGSIPYYRSPAGVASFPSDLYVDNDILSIAFGAGLSLYDPATLVLDENLFQDLQKASQINATIRRDQTLIGGSEGGSVQAWDLSPQQAALMSQLDLRTVTGHTGSEDIEIRSVWTDAFDNLVFASSSWGNDASRSPTLPAFFVLEVLGPLPTVTIAALKSVIGESEGPTDAFVISRTGSTSSPLTVNLSVGGTATSGVDYDVLPGAVTIPAGAASIALRLSPKTDGVTEGDETIVISLNPAAAYSVGAEPSATVTIRDATPLTAAITNPAEGAAVNGTVSVGMSASGASGTPITFTLRVDGAQAFTKSDAATIASFDWDTRAVTPGAHTLSLSVTDGAGRTATATRNVTVGTGSLRVAITQPGADGATVSGTTWFVLWVEGATAGSKTYTLTGGGKQLATTNDTSSGPISMALDTRQLNNGSNTVIASVRDSAGNAGSASRVVNVSNCIPGPFAALITSPTEGATVSGTVPVNMLATGACGTPIAFTLTVDGAQVFTTSGTATSASFNWNTAGAGGAHTLVLTVRDGTGSQVSANRHVTVSNGVPGPKPLITSPPEGATVSGVVTVGMSLGEIGSTATITWTLTIDSITVFTATNQATTATFDWNTSTYAAGPHTLSLTVREQSSGSSVTSDPRHVTVAGTLTASITTPAEGATVGGTVPVGMSESNGTGTITWRLRLDGGSTPIFTTSGLATTASFNWDTTGLAPGAHQLQLTVQDGGGRTATVTRNVTVGAPGTIKVFITQPATDGATVSGTVWFTLWLENAAAGTRNLTLSIDGTAVATTATTSNGPISLPWNSAGVSGGTHTATVSVRDSINNTGNANRTVITPGGPGLVQASFTTPAEGAMVSGTVTVGMAATNAIGTPIVFTLTADGAQVFTTSGTSSTASFDWSSKSVLDGSHTLGLTVQDGAGRTATATRQVAVHQGPPPMQVQFTSPAEGATVGSSITVTASVFSGTIPYTWTVTVDDTTRIFTTSGTASSISFNWDAATVADGPHTLTVSVDDSAGSRATASRNITVKQPVPSTIDVFITQPASDGTTVSGTVWFTIWIEKAAAGTKTYTMSVDAAVVGTTNTTSNGPVSMPWTSNGTPNGGHSVTISVRDAGGAAGHALRAVSVAN